MKKEILNIDKNKYCKKDIENKKPILCQYKQCEKCKVKQ